MKKIFLTFAVFFVEYFTTLWTITTEQAEMMKKSGGLQMVHNKGKIPEKDLSRILTVMQVYYFDFINFYKNYPGTQIKFYK